MKTVIEMAREIWSAGEVYIGPSEENLERFAELVRADERNSWPAEMEAMERQVNMLTDALHQERERMKWDVHSCGPDCKRYACASMREAVIKEREACAKLVEKCEWPFATDGRAVFSTAIRARGNT